MTLERAYFQAYSWQCEVVCISFAPDHCVQGRQAYMEKRRPDFSKFKRLP